MPESAEPMPTPYEIKKHRTANPYEEKFGYSRAVRKGPFVFVSGTTSIDTTTGQVLYPSSAYEQTLKIFLEIISAIEPWRNKRGRRIERSVWAGWPAATMVFGLGFVNPDMRVEIEADAVVL
ncbi:YjgF-like protein [Gymnopilus junonius]|uniref:YjgF-like protein n=1 Tax=Gymnopilus junonius TaxID=109634 RepID=A0A9P5NWH8_GYMJU|nr:YjgF-like protein [Gymnopilus junonius]